MNATSETEHRPGLPRSERDAAFLTQYDARMRLPIIVSAILPLVVTPESGSWVGIVIEVVTWLVFLADYVVHARHVEHYGRTGLGCFDLFVVIATAPWFLLPGAQAGSFVVLLRLARLARLAMASRGSRRLFEQLGRVAVVAAGVLVTGSLVGYYAEHPTNPEFATVGDAFWWGIVTLTTVGYGDIVPKTPAGRLAGVAIMITGIAVLGLLAGSLASFFRLGGDQTADKPQSSEPADDKTAADAALAALAVEVSALRRQVEALTERLTGTRPGPASEESAPSQDAATPLRIIKYEVGLLLRLSSSLGDLPASGAHRRRSTPGWPGAPESVRQPRLDAGLGLGSLCDGGLGDRLGQAGQPARLGHPWPGILPRAQRGCPLLDGGRLPAPACCSGWPSCCFRTVGSRHRGCGG